MRTDAEIGRQLIKTATKWTCDTCPHHNDACKSSERCFNQFLINLQKLLKRTHQLQEVKVQCRKDK